MFHLRQDGLLLGFLVVAAFDIDFQEAVEENLFAADQEPFREMVGSNGHVGLFQPGVGHLAGDSPLPDEVVEAFLRGSSLDFQVAHIGGPDGFVCLLGPFRLGVVVPYLGILRAEQLDDLFFRGVQGEGREVHRVGTHVGDQTGFVEPLGDGHRLADGETELAAGFLLQGGRGERRRRGTARFVLFDGGHMERGTDALFEEGAGFGLGVELAVEHGFDGALRALREEGPFDAEIRGGFESGDLTLAVHDQAECHRLDAAR